MGASALAARPNRGPCAHTCVASKDTTHLPAAAQRHCNTLQHTATHCNTLQHTATHCNTLKNTSHCNTLQHTATHCNTLQPAACVASTNMTPLPAVAQRQGLLNQTPASDIYALTYTRSQRPCAVSSSDPRISNGDMEIAV